MPPAFPRAGISAPLLVTEQDLLQDAYSFREEWCIMAPDGEGSAKEEVAMAACRSFGRWGILLLVLGTLAVWSMGAEAQTYDSSPPAEPVKLIFIHHSCGENWLTDGHGDLGLTLARNNYFVSDTNYGWGPDGIGDRTDIPNWPEWFVGPDSDRYLAALYSESGQHSNYTRTFADPGGENQIVMFKSCFPNSNLEGNPDDPPRREGDWLSVGNAKAIYNELLGYFATRPDKLFIAITAPPVLDPSYGANARGFNNWLVNEWLADYEGTNVAVWDFYNVLTGPDSHHRFQGSYIEHSWGTSNTAYYPTDGDDHPSPAGNRKATEEFVPMLNVYYHLWQPGAPAAPAPAPAPTEAPAEPEAPVPMPIAAAGELIDDFEGAEAGWEVFSDEGAETQLTCGRDQAVSHEGAAGMRIEYEVAPEGWATCSLIHEGPQDWSGWGGLVFFLRTEGAGQPVTVAAYQGDSVDALGSFEYQFYSDQQAVDGWQRVEIPWSALVQPSWEGDGTARFEPGRAMGMAFVFGGESGSGVLWVDDVGFLSGEGGGEVVQLPAVGVGAEESPYPVPEQILEPMPEEPYPVEVAPEEPYPVESEEEVEEPEAEEEGNGICPGSTALGLLALVSVAWVRRQTGR
jgi:hypothetical protein